MLRPTLWVHDPRLPDQHPPPLPYYPLVNLARNNATMLERQDRIHLLGPHRKVINPKVLANQWVYYGFLEARNHRVLRNEKGIFNCALCSSFRVVSFFFFFFKSSSRPSLAQAARPVSRHCSMLTAVAAACIVARALSCLTHIGFHAHHSMASHGPKLCV